MLVTQEQSHRTFQKCIAFVCLFMGAHGSQDSLWEIELCYQAWWQCLYRQSHVTGTTTHRAFYDSDACSKRLFCFYFESVSLSNHVSLGLAMQTRLTLNSHRSAFCVTLHLGSVRDSDIFETLTLVNQIFTNQNCISEMNSSPQSSVTPVPGFLMASSNLCRHLLCMRACLKAKPILTFTNKITSLKHGLSILMELRWRLNLGTKKNEHFGGK